jgi:hypothetical protein
VGGGGAAIGVICVILLIGIPFYLLIMAVILRAACWAANKCLPQSTSRYDDDYDDYDDWDDEDRPRSRRRYFSAKAIPEPGLGQAMLIVFVNLIIGFVVGGALGVVMAAGGMANDPAARLVIQAMNLVLSFLITAGVLTAMLPTTFPRACLVVLFMYLIVIAIAIIIAVPLVMLMFAARA